MTIEQEHLRGASCQNCNISYLSNRFLHVFFHNLAGYDSHHIIKQAYDICDELIEMKPARYDHTHPYGLYKEGEYMLDEDGKKTYVPTKPEVTRIPQTSIFMTFSVGDIKFIDSFKFMATSLDKQVKNLDDKEDKHKHFNFMKKRIPYAL